MSTPTDTEIAAFEQSLSGTAAVALGFDTDTLKSIYRQAVLDIEGQRGAGRPEVAAALLGQRKALQDEAIKRGHTRWQLAKFWT